MSITFERGLLRTLNIILKSKMKESMENPWPHELSLDIEPVYCYDHRVAEAYHSVVEFNV